ncbi:hypothetical protein SKAU_G00126480 [Synaphobranchus kaupii]|uniref:Uncharacterized protein n=1 Tax=Synaphobranchus kaupii TaxID=118154 RepID=A0A9Q1FPP6_SYNKA|nr:hypothetical protein SKAU_G00126480 [Synaphobranchus kaupii]
MTQLSVTIIRPSSSHRSPDSRLPPPAAVGSVAPFAWGVSSQQGGVRRSFSNTPVLRCFHSNSPAPRVIGSSPQELICFPRAASDRQAEQRPAGSSDVLCAEPRRLSAPGAELLN